MATSAEIESMGRRTEARDRNEPKQGGCVTIILHALRKLGNDFIHTLC